MPNQKVTEYLTCQTNEQRDSVILVIGPLNSFTSSGVINRENTLEDTEFPFECSTLCLTNGQGLTFRKKAWGQLAHKF